MGISKIHVRRLKVSTGYEHIEGGKCGDPRRCMERVAIVEALNEQNIFPNKLRVDAGHVRATWDGWRWIADTPKTPHNCLIQWDDDLRHKRPISVKPHRYTLVFRRLSQVKKGPAFSAARRAQINEARKAREKATGVSDTKRYSRVIGHTYI
jgi:hypothetical protein